MEAKCQCGRLSVTAPASSRLVIACHCADCQRRTGSPFGTIAYYPSEQLTITGPSTRFERSSAAGGLVETFFCPTCGSTVCLRLSKQPSMLGVPVGAFNDPSYPAPMFSVWEEGKHHWVAVPAPAEHHRQDIGRR